MLKTRMYPLQNEPLVSVITATRDRPHFLREFIDSALVQDYQNWEIVILDDGSSEETAHLVHQYQMVSQKVTYLREERSRGFTAGIVKALDRARGELACFMGDDDMLMPHMLRLVVREFQKDPDLALVYGNIWQGKQSYQQLVFPEDYRGVQGTILTPAEYVRLRRNGVSMRTPGTVFRMDAYNAIGGINSSLTYTQDSDLWFRFVTQYKSMYLPVPLAFRRLHAQNLTTTAHDKFSRAHIDYWWSTYQQASDRALKKEIRLYIKEFNLHAARYWLRPLTFDFDKYRRHVWRLMLEYPYLYWRGPYREFLYSLMPRWLFLTGRRLKRYLSQREKWRFLFTE